MKAAHRILDPKIVDPTATGRCALAVMTKVPRPGFVKTRLVPPLTPEEAAQINICFLRDTAAAIGDAKGSGGCGIGVYTPLGFESAYEGVLPNEFALLAQRGDGFGERLRNAIEDLLKIGFKAACLIDSDSPTVPADAYRRAVSLLLNNEADVVLGPVEDGGYYLIGMKRLHEQLFQEIDWSTERVLAQTIERTRQVRLKTELLPVFYDIDDAAALERIRNDLLGQPAARMQAPYTRTFLADLISRKEV